MKKYILIFLCLICLFFTYQKRTVQASTSFDKYLYLNDKACVESIYCGQNFQILKFFDKVEYLFENEIITINGHFKAVDVSGDSAYLLVDNKLYKLKNGKIEKTLELLIDFLVFFIFLY